MMGCEDCRLHLYRTNVVLGEGPKPCKVMLIGEAPGRDEDVQGRPFVGSAGKVLDDILRELGYGRKQLYITNCVKCRPPLNRIPAYEETQACRKYLDREFLEVNPHRVITLGLTATSQFLRTYNLSSIHGKRHMHEFPHGMAELIPVYHPAYILYSPNRREVLMEDYRRALDCLEN